MKRKLSFSGKIAVVALGCAASWAAAQTELAKTAVRIEHALVTLIDDVPVPAREAGSLMKLTVKEGAIVQEGDILGQLDNLDALAKREMALSELEVAQAQADSTAELEAAQQGSEVALAEQQQLEQIQSKGAVSIFELRRAKFNYQKSLAQIKVAQTDRTVAKITTKLKQAQIGATDNELARRQVQSPLGGQVVEVYKHVGEWCTPGEPILRVVRLDRVRVEGFVLMAAASPNNILGRPVTVTVYTPGGGTHQVKGTIGFASQLIEGAGSTRQFRVWTEVDNTQIAGGWVIQPGSAAEMLIDMSAPARVGTQRPDASTTSTTNTTNTVPSASTIPAVPRNTSGSKFAPLPPLPRGSKFEARKPAVDDPQGAKEEAPKAEDRKNAAGKDEPAAKAPALPVRPRPATTKPF